MKKRLLAILLTLVITVTYMPSMAFAEVDVQPTEEPIAETTTEAVEETVSPEKNETEPQSDVEIESEETDEVVEAPITKSLMATPQETPVPSNPEAIPDLVFNGKNQNLCTPGTLKITDSKHRYVYKTSMYELWSTSIPTERKAGTHTVYWQYQVKTGLTDLSWGKDSGENTSGNFTACIEKLNLESCTVSYKKARRYTGFLVVQSPSVTYNDETLSTALGDYDLTGALTGTKTGDYEFTIKGDDNCTGELVCKWRIADFDFSLSPTSFTYTGNEQGPSLITELKLDTEFSCNVELTSNDVGYLLPKEIEAGTYSVTVTGIDEFAGVGNKTLTWKINKATPSAEIKAKDNLVYNGEPQELVEVTQNPPEGTHIEYAVLNAPGIPTDFDFSSELPKKTNAGKYYIYYRIISNNPNYENLRAIETGYNFITATINKKLVELKWGETTFTYNGLPQKPADPTIVGLVAGDSCDINVSVLDESGKLDIGHADAGKYTAVASLKFRLLGGDEKNYQMPSVEACEQEFTIQKATVQDGSLVIAPTSFDYDEKSHTSIPVSFEDTNGRTYYWKELAESFDISGNTATEAGDHTLTITAKNDGNFTGSASAEWSISQRSIANASFEAVDVDYNGNPHNPYIIGHEGGLITGDTLVLGTDFEIDYDNVEKDGEQYEEELINAGAYTLHLKGIGKYTGTNEVEWKIRKANLDVTVIPNSLSFDGSDQALVTVNVSPTDEVTDKKYIVKKVGEDYNLLPPAADSSEWDSASKTATATDAGLYAVYCRVTPTGGNYKPTVKGALVRIERAELKAEYVTLYDEDGNEITDNSFTYNDQNHTVKVAVKIDESLVDPSNYDVSYLSVLSATNAGQYHVYITGTVTGNFLPEELVIDKKWKINPKSLESDVSYDKITRTYSGVAQQPIAADLVLKDAALSNKRLVLAKDFLAEINPRTDAGSYSFNVEGIGNYKGTKEIAWKIEPAQISSVEGLVTTFGYDGESHSPSFLVYSKDVGILPLATTSYEKSGDDSAIYAGNYTLTVTGKGNFEGSKNLNWSIAQGIPSYTVNPLEREYSAEPQALVSSYSSTGVIDDGSPKFKYIVEKVGEGAILDLFNPPAVDSEDWINAPKVAEATDAGYYVVFYKVFGDRVNYKDTTGFVISRITKATLTEDNVEITPRSEFRYNGKEKEVQVKVTYNDKTVGESDYRIVDNLLTNSVLKATDTGTYNVYVSATLDGNFKDEGIVLNKTWSITRARQHARVYIADWTYGSPANEPEMINLKEDAEVEYTYAARGSNSWSYQVPTAAGSYTVRAEIAETKNYKAAVEYANFTIAPLNCSKLSIDAIEEQLYTGSAIEPGIVAKHGGYVLKEGTDYSLVYENNVETGTATVTATFAGNYSGTYTTTFDIYGKPSSVLTVKAKTLKGPVVKLTWTTVEGAERYVVYGAKCGKKFKKLKTTKTVSVKVKKASGKKLVAHKSYKFYVVAYDADGNRITKSKAIHYVVKAVKGNTANASKVTVSNKNVELVVGATSKIKAKVKIYKNKKAIKDAHGAKLKYTSNNTDVATVDSKGVITAVRPGTATITVQYVSGASTKVQVTVTK